MDQMVMLVAGMLPMYKVDTQAQMEDLALKASKLVRVIEMQVNEDAYHRGSGNQ